jgi:hypothetical protein
MRELVPAAGYPVRLGGFQGYVTFVGRVAGTAIRPDADTITAAGSMALPPMGFSGQGTVESRRRGRAALSDGETVFLILVWLYAVWLPWVGSRLPPELHGMLSDSYGTIAIALAITWRMFDKHK